MTPLMTVEEVAQYLRVTEKTIYRLLKRGRTPATKVGHQWRFKKSAIDEWLLNSQLATIDTKLFPFSKT